MHQARKHSRSPFTVRPEAAQPFAYFVGGDFRVIEKAVDLLADAPGDISRQAGLDMPPVLIEQRVAEQGRGGRAARLARYCYPSPSLLNYYYPLRSETLLRLTESLMRLSGASLTWGFPVNAVYRLLGLMKLSGTVHDRLMRQSANGIFRHRRVLRALVVCPLRRVQVPAAILCPETAQGPVARDNVQPFVNVTDRDIVVQRKAVWLDQPGLINAIAVVIQVPPEEHPEIADFARPLRCGERGPQLWLDAPDTGHASLPLPRSSA